MKTRKIEVKKSQNPYEVIMRIQAKNETIFEELKENTQKWEDVKRKATYYKYTRTLSDVYSSYSREKEKIFNEWFSFFSRCENLKIFTIYGANSMTFSLTAIIENDDEIQYFFITKNHNYLACEKKRD